MPNFLNTDKFSNIISNFFSKIASPFTSKLETELKEYYVEVINNNPKDSNAYNNLGVLNYEFGNYQQSLKDLTKAININTQYHHHIHYFCSAIYTYLGHINYIKEKYERACFYYEKAIFQHHDNNEANFVLYKILEKFPALSSNRTNLKFNSKTKI